MKIKIKGYWIIIAFVILANVGIFFFFSNRLENLVTAYTVEVEIKNGM